MLLRRRPQQDQQRAMPAVGRACLGEGNDLALLREPAFHFCFEHRLAPRRAVALAVDHTNAAQAVPIGVAQECAEPLACLVAAQTVQVELTLDRPDAATQLANDFGPDAAATI